MKTPLNKVEIISIYKVHGERVLLPERMAKSTPDTQTALKAISIDLKDAGGKLVLSDLFRSYDMQLQAHLDWKTGKKRAYSPPPGGSLHEAGRAFDLSLKDMKIKLSDFWDIAKAHGMVPIISTPDKRKSEAWHFECRGSHQVVYDYYKDGHGANMKPYKAMAASSILSIGVIVDKYDSNQEAAYLQSCLVRLGLKLGNIDGLIGRKTKQAVADAGSTYTNLEEAIVFVEDEMQKKYPNEFRKTISDEGDIFDYDVPEDVDG
ncbi:MAG: D-alanyl-D-alanine carboxypeptidase family protein [Candidatus Competibacteraceae bacterium]|nr:D-alanyl-D-alanine carboxypeptidase family protein [Candidatus Competibacteraceae bacterium]